MSILARYFLTFFASRVLAFVIVCGALAFQILAERPSDRFVAFALSVPFAASLGASTTFYELARNDEIKALLWCGIRTYHIVLPGLVSLLLLVPIPLFVAIELGERVAAIAKILAIAELASIVAVCASAISAVCAPRNEPFMPFIVSLGAVGVFYVMCFGFTSQLGNLAGVAIVAAIFALFAVVPAVRFRQ